MNTETMACAKCGSIEPVASLNADDLCGVCAALASLRDTLEKRGIIHPTLFDRSKSQLPPSDRD
jgi:hypothetical protein